MAKKQKNLLQQQQQAEPPTERSRLRALFASRSPRGTAATRSSGPPPAQATAASHLLGRSPLNSIHDDLSASSQEDTSTSPPWSPTSFASGLLDSRRGKRLESYDFTNRDWVNLDLFQSHSALAQQDLCKSEEISTCTPFASSCCTAPKY
jgi:hypothetical protein